MFGEKGKFDYSSSSIIKTTVIIAIAVGFCLLLFILFGNKSEPYANTSPATDTRSVPDFPDYQVMSQLPWDNFPVGRGEMNYAMQVANNEDFPRHRWLIEVPISRPPDEVSLYQTGMFVDPAIMNISTGK